LTRPTDVCSGIMYVPAIGSLGNLTPSDPAYLRWREAERGQLPVFELHFEVSSGLWEG
jgi:hypothetical protein